MGLRRRQQWSAEHCGQENCIRRHLGGLVPVDPEVLELSRRAAQGFESFGCDVQEDCFDASDVPEIISGTRAFNLIARFADRLDAFQDKMSLSLVRQVTGALRFDLRTVTKSERLRTSYWHRVRAFLDKYDYIITPTIGVPPFWLDRPLPKQIGQVKVERFYDVLLATYAFSLTGLPAIAVPCGLNSDGLPVGFQIIGRRHREDSLLEAAAAYAMHNPQRDICPEVDRNSIRPIHPEFESTFAGFVGDAARLGG